MKEIMKTKTMMKKDNNAMKIITEAVIQSIIMKNDQMMVVKITIKEDMLRLNTEKKEVKQIEIMKEITRDYCYYEKVPERNEDHKRRISNKNDDIVIKRADYGEEKKFEIL